MNITAPFPLLLMALMVCAGHCTARPRPSLFSYFKGLFYTGDSKEATTTSRAAMEPPVARATLDHDHVDVSMLKVALPAPHATAGDHVHLRLPQLHHHAPAGHPLDVDETQPPHENDHSALSVHSSDLHYG
ncbi:uncharacterized protein LOC126252506 [Schistocerca nitens]|uniref:uncharacterized protein LOC126252506 n=1 Tax=Schistocerca nitens TaxID=7011 RepID=UPI002117AD95|nr:uncharacterized protein LOC126252506 [Schistocerca nitens]